MSKITNAVKKELKYHTIGKAKRMVKKWVIYPVILGFILSLVLTGCTNQETAKNQITTQTDTSEETTENITVNTTENFDVTPTDSTTVTTSEESEIKTYDIPDYNGKLSVEINNNIPDLNREDADNGVFIRLSELDELGRCGTAYMCAGPETLAKEERGEIGHVKPSGWHTVKYPDVIPDKYLYNRSHLLMFALCEINDDERNLITGTRQLNADKEAGMLHYEEIVLDYIQNTGNHVLYKVTPVFKDDNLLAYGVEMEALSVEDDTVCFHVFVYNVQNGISIDYATGESQQTETSENTEVTVTSEITEITETAENEKYYILNTNTMKIHQPTCDSVEDILDKNRKEYNGNIDELLEQGYTKCKKCF